MAAAISSIEIFLEANNMRKKLYNDSEKLREVISDPDLWILNH